MLTLPPPSSRRSSLKVCGVCGDRAKSYHFGGISCDSCKAFFRRSVQHDAYKSFRCSTGVGHCRISMASRKSCQRCRFFKCIAIGMETSWVMTDEERLKLHKSRHHTEDGEHNKHRRHRHHHHHHDHDHHRNHRSIEISRSSKFVGSEMPQIIPEVTGLLDAFTGVFPDLGVFQYSDETATYSKLMVVTTFMVSVRQIIEFAQGLDFFAQLAPQDQVSLLKATVFEVFVVLHAFAIFQKDPSQVYSVEKGCPFMRMSSSPHSDLDCGTFPMPHQRLAAKLGSLIPDISTLVLFVLTIMCRPEAPGITCSELIECQQMEFVNLLKKHMDLKLGPERAAIGFPKLLLTLPDIRQFQERHASYHLIFEENQIKFDS